MRILLVCFLFSHFTFATVVVPSQEVEKVAKAIKKVNGNISKVPKDIVKNKFFKQGYKKYLSDQKKIKKKKKNKKKVTKKSKNRQKKIKGNDPRISEQLEKKKVELYEKIIANPSSALRSLALNPAEMTLFKKGDFNPEFIQLLFINKKQMLRYLPKGTMVSEKILYNTIVNGDYELVLPNHILISKRFKNLLKRHSTKRSVKSKANIDEIIKSIRKKRYQREKDGIDLLVLFEKIPMKLLKKEVMQSKIIIPDKKNSINKFALNYVNSLGILNPKIKKSLTQSRNLRVDDIPYSLYSDESFMREYLYNSPRYLEKVSWSIANDPKLIERIIKKDGMYLKYIEKEVINDKLRNIAIKTWGKDHKKNYSHSNNVLLEYFDVEKLSDEKFAEIVSVDQKSLEKAMKLDKLKGSLLKIVNKKSKIKREKLIKEMLSKKKKRLSSVWKNDKELARKVLQKDGLKLKDFSYEITKDIELVRLAVKNNKESIQYANAKEGDDVMKLIVKHCTPKVCKESSAIRGITKLEKLSDQELEKIIDIEPTKLFLLEGKRYDKMKKKINDIDTLVKKHARQAADEIEQHFGRGSYFPNQSRFKQILNKNLLNNRIYAKYVLAKVPFLINKFEDSIINDRELLKIVIKNWKLTLSHNMNIKNMLYRHGRMDGLKPSKSPLENVTDETILNDEKIVQLALDAEPYTYYALGNEMREKYKKYESRARMSPQHRSR